MASVELQNITKVFPGGVRAVDGLSLSIADEEMVVLVGPSGCGKSTTLRMIAGLEEPTEGRIVIGGRPVNGVSPGDRDIAMVFQNHALYPHMTVYANLAFGLKMRRFERAEIHRRVLRAAAMLDIQGLLDRKPAALSGGQRQRVALGRAMVRQPAAFLLDEPLSQLDPKLRLATRAELKRLHRQMRTSTLYVTHDQEEAMTLGDRIVVMKDGRIHQSGTPLAAYNSPVNRFVAGFIGMPPMNFLDGVIRSDQGRLIFEEAKAARQVFGGAGEAEPGAPELTLATKGFRLVVPSRLREAARRRLGMQVVLGIRPEHFHLESPGVEEEASIEVHVTVVEPLGNDIDVYAKTTLHDPVVARVQAREGLVVGCAVRLHADARKIHFFEPGETGMNLSLTSEPAHAIA